MRRLGTEARRPGGHGNLCEAEQQRFAFHPGDLHVQVPRQARRDRAVHRHVTDLREQTLPEAIPELREPLALTGELGRGHRTRGAESHDAGDVQRAAAKAALLPATGHGRAHPLLDAARDEQRADALRPVQLVGAEGRQVHAQRVNVQRQLAERLDRVGMHERPVMVGEPRNLGHRLDHADLVVRQHHAHERRGRRDRRRHLCRIDQSRRRHGQLGDRPAFGRQPSNRFEHGLVLGHQRHHVPPIGGRGHSGNRQVIRFGRAAREDHLTRVGAHQRRHLLARAFHRVVSHPACLDGSGSTRCRRGR